MPVAPEIVAGFGVDDRKIGVARGRGFGIVGDAILGNVTVIVDRARLVISENDVSAVIEIGGEEKDEIGLGAVGNDFVFVPFLELCQGLRAYAVGTSSIQEENGLGILNP